MIHVDNALWLLMEKNPTLNPYAGEIRMHLDRYNDRRWHLNGLAPLTDFANGHRYFGFHRTETGWVFREWLCRAGAARTACGSTTGASCRCCVVLRRVGD